MCINTAKLTFHCQTPLVLLHKVEVSDFSMLVAFFFKISLLFLLFAECIVYF